MCNPSSENDVLVACRLVVVVHHIPLIKLKITQNSSNFFLTISWLGYYGEKFEKGCFLDDVCVTKFCLGVVFVIIIFRPAFLI